MGARHFEDSGLTPDIAGDDWGRSEAAVMADRLLVELLRAFSYPVVPSGKAESRLRCPPHTQGCILIKGDYGI